MNEKIESTIASVVELLKGLIPQSKTDVLKSVDKEQRRALFIAMEPDVYDAHGDITSAEEIEKACNNFNTHCMKANLFHLVDTDAVEIQQSFVSISDAKTESGREIKKGTWLMWMHFPEGNPESDVLWDMVKSNDINGLSIQAKGYKEPIEEE